MSIALQNQVITIIITFPTCQRILKRKSTYLIILWLQLHHRPTCLSLRIRLRAAVISGQADVRPHRSQVYLYLQLQYTSCKPG